MAPNVTVDSLYSSPVEAKIPAFSLDALIAQCRQKKASTSVLPSTSSDDSTTSKKPAFSLDALIAQCQSKKSAPVTPSISCSASEIDELTQKLSLLQKTRKQVMQKTGRVSELVEEKYPELSIARAVQKSNEKRTRDVRDKYGWRQYLGVYAMREKADEMIENEKADRLKMFDDLAVELKTITKAIAATNARLQNASRKRPVEPALEDGELLEAPQKKKRRSE